MKENFNIDALRQVLELLIEANENEFSLELFDRAMEIINLNQDDKIFNKTMLLINMGNRKQAIKFLFENMEFIENRNRLFDFMEQMNIKFNCPVAQMKSSKLLPLPDEYENLSKKHSFPYSFDEFETLNYKMYVNPISNSIDRERLYALFINEAATEIPIGKKEKVLDFAPSFVFAKFMKSKTCFEYITADYLLPNYDFQVDIQDMSRFESNSFGGVICSHVLEHIENDKKALSEIHRILKPKGWAIIMSPICLSIDNTKEDKNIKTEADRWREYGQGDHLRLYAKDDFKRKIVEAGFELSELGNDHFSKMKFAENGISQKSVLYVAYKK